MICFRLILNLGLNMATGFIYFIFSFNSFFYICSKFSFKGFHSTASPNCLSHFRFKPLSALFRMGWARVKAQLYSTASFTSRSITNTSSNITDILLHHVKGALLAQLFADVLLCNWIPKGSSNCQAWFHSGTYTSIVLPRVGLERSTSY